jgi:hypothetical protein
MKTRALLLGAAASLAFAGTAEAGWYLGAEGGGNWIGDNQYDWGTGVAVSDFDNAASYDSGWAFMATLGHSFPGGWRAEVEAGYRSNDVDLFASSAGNALFREGEVTEFSLMGNLLHDFPISSSTHFTLGAGVGMDMSNLDEGAIDEGDSTIAYQGIVGFSHALSPTTEVTVTYRYFVADGPEYIGPHIGTAHDDVYEFEAMTKHTLTLGFRFNM